MRTMIYAILLMVLLPLRVLALDPPDIGTSFAYPLPAHQGTVVNLVYTMAESGTPQILVYSESGDQVMTFNDLKPAGLQASQIDLCCLAPGVYLYFVTLRYDSGRVEKLKAAKFAVVR